MRHRHLPQLSLTSVTICPGVRTHAPRQPVSHSPEALPVRPECGSKSSSYGTGEDPSHLPLDPSVDVEHSLQRPCDGLYPFARREYGEHSRMILPPLPLPAMLQTASPSIHPWNCVANPGRPPSAFVSRFDGSDCHYVETVTSDYVLSKRKTLLSFFTARRRPSPPSRCRFTHHDGHRFQVILPTHQNHSYVYVQADSRGR